MNITSKTIKDGLKGNGYTPQKLGFDKRRPFNLGLHGQKSGILVEGGVDSPFKMTSDEYWYKIGGKAVTKAQYNAHENPVGDGPTKSTNDPDASGNKAKIEEARANNKASKRPTALTKNQTKIKDQGTKVPKKRPPFKKKTTDTPLHFNWKDALDNTQTALMGAGMIPAIGNAADLINAGISGGRAAYHKYKGNNKEALKHSGNAALNLAAAVPVAGQAVAGSRLAVKAGSGIAKGVKIAKNVDRAKEVVKRGKQVGKLAKKAKKGSEETKITMLNKNRKRVKNIA
jgi:hypothetical protein